MNSVENHTVTPIRPAVEPSGFITVQVAYGPNMQEFELRKGDNVAAILGNTYISEIIGFRGGSGESVTVNGKTAATDYVLSPGDRVEIIKKAGEKA